MSDTIKLGQIIKGEAERDAIHVAIAPVVAMQHLEPGEHANADGTKVNPIGIVDPFLTRGVRPGETFYLCLYPNTVTGMRHHWQHPAFSDTMKGMPTSGKDRSASEQWLRDYAVKMNPYDVENGDTEKAYQRLLAGLRKGNLFAYGTDCHALYDVDDSEELRYHAEQVLGIRIDWNNFGFSCSC